MKIKFLATGISPDFYRFDGEAVYINHNGIEEEVSFTDFDYGDTYEGIEFGEIKLVDVEAIREARRDSNGELYLTLCQESKPGAWRESDWIDSKDYLKGRLYIKEVQDGEIKKENFFGLV